MPQVASDPTFRAQNQVVPRQGRPPQQSDRAPSPFENLLDDSAPAADQATQTNPENKTAGIDRSQAPTRNNDCKTAPANDDTTRTDDVNADDTAGNGGKPVSANKAAVTAILAEGPTSENGDKPVADEKTANGQKTDNPAVTQPTVVAPDAIAAAAVPAPTPVATAGQDGQENQPVLQAPLAGDAAPQLKTIDLGAPKTTTGKKADATEQTDSEKRAGTEPGADGAADSGLTANHTPQAHKAQVASGESDKQNAQARGEVSVDGHRAGNDSIVAVPGDVSASIPKATTDTGTQPTFVTPDHNVGPAAGPAPVSQTGPQPAAVPLAGIAIEIAGKALAGKNRFEIRLDPPELGRIDVRLDVDRDGNVTSRLTVDRADTYDLLRRDAAGLERALQDAGLKTSDNGLQFSLRDQSSGQQQARGGADTARLVVQDETLPAPDVIPQNHGRLAGQGGGLDIRV